MVAGFLDAGSNAFFAVIPAKAGIHRFQSCMPWEFMPWELWIPAFAGMTAKKRVMRKPQSQLCPATPALPASFRLTST